MKNTYKVILIGLVVLGIVYAGTGPENKTKEENAKNKWKYKPIDICTFPVSIEVGHFIQLKECGKRKIKLEQVDCESIGREYSDFPCYKGCDIIEVKANFPAIFNASLDKSNDDNNMLKDFNLYWKNDVNTIQGNGEWEELQLCMEAWNVEIWKSKGIIGTIEIGDITIVVKPPDDCDDNTKNDTDDDTKLED